ncbi:MAG: hypothetical protein IJ599_03995 [Alphaproteobacteria bacterium]|nr:hypothetical protein [Alphaproteobacteria bacterium]
MIRDGCSANYVDIISENVSHDHVHMLISKVTQHKRRMLREKSTD